MSISLIVTGQYRNNKKVSVGTFQPLNYNFIETWRMKSFMKRVADLIPILPKFKNVTIELIYYGDSVGEDQTIHIVKNGTLLEGLLHPLEVYKNQFRKLEIDNLSYIAFHDKLGYSASEWTPTLISWFNCMGESTKILNDTVAMSYTGMSRIIRNCHGELVILKGASL